MRREEGSGGGGEEMRGEEKREPEKGHGAIRIYII